MKQGEIREAAAALGTSLDDPQVEALVRYEGLLRQRGIPLGLIAKGDAGRLWERHILDCLRAAPIPEEVSSGYDLGSGAGLPGIVVAVARPDLRVVLVERRRRRAGFLEWPLRVLLVVGGFVLATPGGGVIPFTGVQIIGIALAILVPTLLLALLLVRWRTSSLSPLAGRGSG